MDKIGVYYKQVKAIIWAYYEHDMSEKGFRRAGQKP